jgi:methyl-accepting chemotaxis protein
VGTLSFSMDGAKPYLVDKIKALYDVEATIFAGNARVSTTITKDGQRIIGTKADSMIAEVVLKNGNDYRGRANVNEMMYVASYKPIKGVSGETLGMLFSGKNLQTYYDDRNHQLMVVGALTILVMAVCLLLAYGMSTRLHAPIFKLTVGVSAVASGDLSRNISVASGDEFEKLADDFNAMVGELRKLVSMVMSKAEGLTAASQEMTSSLDQSAATATLMVQRS